MTTLHVFLKGKFPFFLTRTMPNISLKRFMIFNSSEGRDESRESDKLLYHWTKDEEISLIEKINDVCLCDASVNFGHHLNKANKYEGSKHRLTLTFERTLVVILEVENNLSIWMAAHVAPPDQLESASSNCIPAAAVEEVINSIYDRFCLLNGTFQMISNDAKMNLEDVNDEKLREMRRDRMRNVCREYFDSVLPDIHLNSIISNITRLYNYIHYLDLQPITLMKVNSFINHLVCINSFNIQHTILLFNDQLIWSSLGMQDTRLLYNYMVSILIRNALQEELSKEVDKVRRLKEDLPLFITSENTEFSCSEQKQDKSFEKLYLTVFRSRNNMTLGLLLNEPNLKDLIQKCEEILTSDSRLGVIPLVSLAQSVGQSFLKANSYSHSQLPSHTPTLSDFVFMDRLDASIIWANSMDMLNKEHLILTMPEGSGQELQPRRLRLLRYLIELDPELKELERELDCQVEEFYGRTVNDSWLTVTNSKYRTIYSLHHARNSGLCEAQQSALNMKSLFSKKRF